MVFRPDPIPILSSVADLAKTTDAWIVDVWGVMHNGVTAHGSAVHACERFRDRGGAVILVTNAPRPASAVAAQLDGIGVPRRAYDAIVTSGDVTKALVASWHGKPLLHIGPSRDLGIFEGLAANLDEESRAEAVVCSGLCDDNRETPDDYRERFERLVRRGLPMICANPDIKVERGDKLVWCAGGLAESYARLGGKVTYAGKPHPPIYARAHAEAERVKGHHVRKERVLAIGDSIETDIRGADNAGIRSLFVASGIHVIGPLTATKLGVLFAETPFRPVAAQTALAW